MWSDNETDSDLLGFNHLESAITEIVRNDNLLPASIGVFGDWGGGKSSLLRMVERELANDEDTLVLWFNGWMFEGYEDAKTALMGSIIDEIVTKVTLSEKISKSGKEIALRLLKQIPILGMLKAGGRAAVGFAAAGPIGATASLTYDGIAVLNKFISESSEYDKLTAEDITEKINRDEGRHLRRGIREFREDFKSLLDQTNISKLVVIIDDLDRCSPDTIIETLEAIKLFLFVPKTAFVIGADERLVQYAVRRRFPELPGEKVEVGRDYLEKLIQYPVRVPPLGQAEMQTYINLLFARDSSDINDEQFEQLRKTATDAKPEKLFAVQFNHAVALKVLKSINKELGENLALSESIAPLLAAGLLGNPRQCKRFLNTLMMRMSMAQSRGFKLKQRVLVKLMLLEYFQTETFRKLAEAQSQQSGYPSELRAAEEATANRSPKTSRIDNVNKAKKATFSATDSTKKKSDDDEAVNKDIIDTQGDIIPIWLSGPTISTWLQSEPKLSSEDLRPYYFFARDKLESTLSVSVLRMSPAAQDILNSMLSPSESEMKNALHKAAGLSPVDAAAVFQTLAGRAKQEEDHGVAHSAVFRIIKWAETRNELFEQLITFFTEFPDVNLPPSIAPKLASAAKKSTEKAMAMQVISRWSECTSNLALQVAANGIAKKGTL